MKIKIPKGFRRMRANEFLRIGDRVCPVYWIIADKLNTEITFSYMRISHGFNFPRRVGHSMVAIRKVRK